MLFVYATAADAAEAERIGRTLVAERLVACANVLPAMRSIYRWQGKIEEADEAVLILKTQATRLSALIARMKELHSYEVPCIEAIEIKEGNPEFLAWVERETGGG
ncbi:MAG: divalent-cation tolerance protein CutA [Stellaceae bacterium]